MDDDRTLFDQAPAAGSGVLPDTAPFTPGSPESAEAARDIAAKLPKKRADVLHYMAARGDRGAITDELEWHFQNVRGWAESTARARLNELTKADLVVKGPKGDTRETRAGKVARVQHLTDLGRGVARMLAEG